ncbi:hypothetical protein BT96DRAFT_266937 [Gymnopus androsaceus JB14]|uniref:Uncharacterized protein n=1 Tax=Gymnopus androsaceus JB14 TaxID=1447944 RepID=A0A6A4I682_9AGAR|nr:hypothetical protein BT96DRAFT_266937 [Gymnopus androsaceus JB14]
MKPSRHSIELANADIFRLMDPSYHSSSSEQAKAYIDCRGEMHDPDFHYFPVYPGRRMSDPLSRSRWEDEDDELEEKESRAQQYHRRQSSRRPRSSQNLVRDYPIYPASTSNSYSSSTPSSYSSPPPSSPYTSVSEDKHHHHYLLSKRFRRHSVGYTSSLDLSSCDDYTGSEEIDSDQGHRSGAEVFESSHHTESYSQTMKKQWLVVSLSVRFRIFRARKRASSCTRSKKT